MGVLFRDSFFFILNKYHTTTSIIINNCMPLRPCGRAKFCWSQVIKYLTRWSWRRRVASWSHSRGGGGGDHLWICSHLTWFEPWNRSPTPPTHTPTLTLSPSPLSLASLEGCDKWECTSQSCLCNMKSVARTGFFSFEHVVTGLKIKTTKRHKHTPLQTSPLRPNRIT